MDPENAEIQQQNSERHSASVSLMPHLALDIGGSLVKLVYFSKYDENLAVSDGNGKYPILEGSIRFSKFETKKIDDCLDFIRSKQLHIGGCQHGGTPSSEKIIVKATGGGAYKFANLLNEKLGINLDKEDEIDCLVTAANFLLKAVHREAFTHMDGKKKFVQIDPNDLYPYLLVNIGSGVSMIKVEGDNKYERVSGTSIGGGTFWGLGKLLTKCKSFDELLEMSHQGNNRAVDMLVGDIYGGTDYSKIGLSSTTIASSFGKAISDIKELEDFTPEDISRSLLRMISNNIAQIAYLNALLFGLKRIFFGGFFIGGHEYTMNTISDGVNFWSQGEAKAMFLRHEGFLGGLGAFMSHRKYDLSNLIVPKSIQPSTACASMTNLSNGDLTEDEGIECSVYAG